MDSKDKLDQATQAVRKARNSKVFLDFLEAFKQEEQLHINHALNPEDPKDFNLRSASLCAEAYAAASLMSQMIKGEI